MEIKAALHIDRVEATHQNFQVIQLIFPVDSLGTRKTVMLYFWDKYNYRLKHGSWPCLQGGGDPCPAYLPMELKYHNSGREKACAPSAGKWKSANLKFLSLCLWMLALHMLLGKSDAQTLGTVSCNIITLSKLIGGYCTNKNPDAICCKAVINVIDRGLSKPCICEFLKTGIKADNIINFYHTCNGQNAKADQLLNLCRGAPPPPPIENPQNPLSPALIVVAIALGIFILGSIAYMAYDFWKVKTKRQSELGLPPLQTHTDLMQSPCQSSPQCEMEMALVSNDLILDLDLSDDEDSIQTDDLERARRKEVDGPAGQEKASPNLSGLEKIKSGIKSFGESAVKSTSVTGTSCASVLQRRHQSPLTPILET